MKTFDTDAIKDRYITRLQADTNWKRILDEATISSLMSLIAEGDAELARYFEYLLREAKWDLAQNKTSLLSMAPYLGYKAKRKISAIGTVTISHDPLLSEAGTSFFESDLSSLSVYTGTDIVIPRGTKVSDGSRTFLTTTDVTYSPNINGVATKYIQVPIIQGTVRNFTTQSKAAGIAFETVQVYNDSIENAEDTVSQQFLSVLCYLGGNLSSTPITFTLFDDIHLASSDDYAYDITTAADFSYVTLRFGDGNSGKILPAGSILQISYLESLGASGNQAEMYTINQFNVSASSLINNLYCTNFSACLGGTDEDAIEDIRGKAPTKYLLEGSVITEDAYKAAIESIPSISKATVYSGVDKDEFGIYRDTIRYSAINTIGEAPEASFIENAVLTRLLGKKSPLDQLVYELPTFVRFKAGVIAKISNKEADLVALATQMKNLIYNRYNVFTMNFQEGFDPTDLVNILKNNVTSAQNINLMLEAFERLAPSTFTSSAGGSMYEKSFAFDKSLVSLKNFAEGKKYLLKVNLDFKCTECQSNSRTLFVLQDGNSYKVVQYPLITNNTTTDYMLSSVLKPNFAPDEIPVGASNYIPITLTVNDISQDLYSGTIAIPLKKPGSTEYYLNFASTDTETLDAAVNIDVCAEPYSYDITMISEDPLLGTPEKKRIIKIEEDDITIELSYKSA